MLKVKIEKDGVTYDIEGSVGEVIEVISKINEKTAVVGPITYPWPPGFPTTYRPNVYGTTGDSIPCASSTLLNDGNSVGKFEVKEFANINELLDFVLANEQF